MSTTYLIGLSVTSRTRAMTSCAMAGVAWVSITMTRVVADDDARVGVALGGIGIGARRQLGEADGLGLHVGLAGKCLVAHPGSPLSCVDQLIA